eukprot:TRINITY_DN22411_c0_g1_i1.p1 TRINITY_DN22411_c0_g1~~TRINITY_DN22411_c0_g1_i1.p1  ORF type:complete len:692 (-),score=154.98 TRINITY_DN22411_c0_g1_i1:163-2238(-)
MFELSQQTSDELLIEDAESATASVGLQAGTGSTSTARFRSRAPRETEVGHNGSLIEAIGRQEKSETWSFDFSPKLLVPLRLRQPVEQLMRGQQAGVAGGRMVRKVLWSKYGQPMHFFNLEFEDLVIESEYDKDVTRRIQNRVRRGVFAAACLGFFNSFRGFVYYDDPLSHGHAWYPLLVASLYSLQLLQLSLDWTFVQRQFQHVLFFWAMLQAGCIVFFLWVVTPNRYPYPGICAEPFDDHLSTSNMLDLQSLASSAVEQISAFGLMGLLIYRMRFVYFIYVNVVVMGGYLAFLVYNWLCFGLMSTCMPTRNQVRHAFFLNSVLVFMSYAIEMLQRKDFIQASMVWKEGQRSNALLLNILPGPVVEQLKCGSGAVAQSFQGVTVLFADVVSFTTMSAQISAPVLVELLNRMFHRFDEIAERNGVEKIKTIGDCYMCGAGLPLVTPEHATMVAHFGLQMLEAVASGDFRNPATGEPLRVRAGLHSGPAVAGVIGTRKFAYDLWGDAVNTASRMESHGEPMKLHCSEDSYKLLQEHFECEARERMTVKGKGEMQTYFVLRARRPQRSMPDRSSCLSDISLGSPKDADAMSGRREPPRFFGSELVPPRASAIAAAAGQSFDVASRRGSSERPGSSRVSASSRTSSSMAVLVRQLSRRVTSLGFEVEEPPIAASMSNQQPRLTETSREDRLSSTI